MRMQRFRDNSSPGGYSSHAAVTSTVRAPPEEILLPGDPIEEERSVEVIELVLQDARLESACRDGNCLAGRSPGRRLDRCRPPYVRRQVWDAEAALAPELVAGRAHERRVDEHEQPVATLGLRMTRHVHDDDPDRLADLRRREP